jgi:alkanesulfonate monooxygenase SsuD/methylene tetrahydromethanopterin reductase-like flavin-dependent oxidoreductase (luciferase family)
VRGLLGEEPFTYQGTHLQVTDATTAPGPVQQPCVTLLIAGGGERGTLRQVAQYADMSNFGPHPDVGSAFVLDDVRRKYDLIHRYCEEFGRPYDGILRSYIDMPILSETRAAADTKVDAMPADSRAYFGPALHGSTPDETTPILRIW